MPDRLWLRLHLCLVLCLSIGFIGFHAKLSLYHPVFETCHVSSTKLVAVRGSKMEISERFCVQPDFSVLVAAIPDLSSQTDSAPAVEVGAATNVGSDAFPSYWFKRPPPEL